MSTLEWTWFTAMTETGSSLNNAIYSLAFTGVLLFVTVIFLTMFGQFEPLSDFQRLSAQITLCGLGVACVVGAGWLHVLSRRS